MTGEQPLGRTSRVAVVETYVAAFARGDAEAVAALFAAEATVEDPVGTRPVVGRAAILDFYRAAMHTCAVLTLTGPIREAGHAVAFSFTVDLLLEGCATVIDVIDIFRFDEDGLIASMEAYFGPDNFRAADAASVDRRLVRPVSEGAARGG